MSNDHLSRIATSWSLLGRALETTDDAAAARQLLVERYGGTVRRFLTAVLRDADAADELTQVFALGLIRGGFGRADRSRAVPRLRQVVPVPPRRQTPPPRAPSAPAPSARRFGLSRRPRPH